MDDVEAILRKVREHPDPIYRGRETEHSWAARRMRALKAEGKTFEEARAIVDEERVDCPWRLNEYVPQEFA